MSITSKLETGARAHRGNGVALRNAKDAPQVNIRDVLKLLCPTEMLENEPPRRANVEIIFKRLSS
jgi:hypothetical protein